MSPTPACQQHRPTLPTSDRPISDRCDPNVNAAYDSVSATIQPVVILPATLNTEVPQESGLAVSSDSGMAQVLSFCSRALFQTPPSGGGSDAPDQ